MLRDPLLWGISYTTQLAHVLDLYHFMFCDPTNNLLKESSVIVSCVISMFHCWSQSVCHIVSYKFLPNVDKTKFTCLSVCLFGCRYFFIRLLFHLTYVWYLSLLICHTLLTIVILAVYCIFWCELFHLFSEIFHTQCVTFPAEVFGCSFSS